MKPMTRDGVLRGGVAVLIRLLILVAAGISTYLLFVSASGGTAAGCGIGSACDEVLKSRWAYVLGLPVSALALFVDVPLFFATLACGVKSTPKQRCNAWELLVPCAVLVLGAALWFVAVQAFVLHRFCPWCMMAHACGATAAVLLLMRVPVSLEKAESGKRKAEISTKDPTLTRSKMVRLAIVAIAGVALLGVAQVTVPHKTYSVTTISNDNTAAVTPNPKINSSPATLLSPTNNAGAAPQISTAVSNVAKAVETNVTGEKLLASQGLLPMFGSRVVLDLNKAPVWGSPSAPLKLVSLYDYTCHHCRDMHPHVVELQKIFGDKLAIVSLPMPLDAQCNYLLTRTQRPQSNACVYAKLGLAVWRARHDAIQPFDDWLFGFQQPPPLSEVTNKAVQLVGTVPFEAAIRDPWIDQQLRTDIDLFAISMKEYRQGNMPQFMIGTNIVTGVVPTEQLRAVVAKYLEAPPADK